jgi:hypothetical protein
VGYFLHLLQELVRILVLLRLNLHHLNLQQDHLKVDYHLVLDLSHHHLHHHLFQ